MKNDKTLRFQRQPSKIPVALPFFRLLHESFRINFISNWNLIHLGG